MKKNSDRLIFKEKKDTKHPLRQDSFLLAKGVENFF